MNHEGYSWIEYEVMFACCCVGAGNTADISVPKTAENIVHLVNQFPQTEYLREQVVGVPLKGRYLFVHNEVQGPVSTTPLRCKFELLKPEPMSELSSKIYGRGGGFYVVSNQPDHINRNSKLSLPEMAPK